MSITAEALRIRRVECFVFRYPLDVPVRTSFGVMADRPMLLVRVEDDTGAFGWGEVWCNFPAVGTEHRARLIDSVLAPALIDTPFLSPEAAFDHLSNHIAVLAIQSGEPGPFAQSIAGLDLALWDLQARKAELPLWKMLGGIRSDIPVYASGLNPDRPEVLAQEQYDQGFRAFKLKVGFGMAKDKRNLHKLRRMLGESVRLMVDANQAWTLEEARENVNWLGDHRLDWLEEPLRADRPLSEWKTLQACTKIPLAAGENMTSTDSFDAAIRSKAMQVVQPDIAKWGGLSKCVPIAKKTIAAGLTYCPHYLGGGIGLLGSAHVLAAVGGDGILEIDVNPNPLRTMLNGTLRTVSDGRADLGDAPGLGITPDLAPLLGYRIDYHE